MSANAFAEDVAKAKQAGVTEYLVKPLDLKKLQKILKKKKTKMDFSIIRLDDLIETYIKIEIIVKWI